MLKDVLKNLRLINNMKKNQSMLILYLIDTIEN